MSICFLQAYNLLRIMCIRFYDANNFRSKDPALFFVHSYLCSHTSPQKILKGQTNNRFLREGTSIWRGFQTLTDVTFCRQLAERRYLTLIKCGLLRHFDWESISHSVLLLHIQFYRELACKWNLSQWFTEMFGTVLQWWGWLRTPPRTIPGWGGEWLLDSSIDIMPSGCLLQSVWRLQIATLSSAAFTQPACDSCPFQTECRSGPPDECTMEADMHENEVYWTSSVAPQKYASNVSPITM